MKEENIQDEDSPKTNAKGDKDKKKFNSKITPAMKPEISRVLLPKTKLEITSPRPGHLSERTLTHEEMI